MMPRRLPHNRRVLWGVGVATFFVVCAVAWFFLIAERVPVEAINVPHDYPTIQSALEHALPDATIVVQAAGGPYEGPLVVDTSDISILAAGGRTMIECKNGEVGVTIGARGVTLRGFEIRSSGIGVRLERASSVQLDDLLIEGARIGIQAIESNGNVMTSITVRNGDTGIGLTSANRNTLRQIQISSMTLVGIRLSNAWSNTIEDAIVSRSKVGVSLEDNSEENRIVSLVGDDCSTSGVEILSSSSNIVTASTFTDCATGVLLNISPNNTVENNRIRNSLKCGISLYKSQQNAIFFNSITDGLKDGISLCESQDNSVAHNSITGCGGTAITLEGAKSSLVLDNKIDRNAIGIQGLEGVGNRILRNELSGNVLAGVAFSEGSENLFLDNTIVRSAYGLVLIGSTKNQMLRNSITDSSAEGVSLLNHANQNLLQDNAIEKNHTCVLVAASSQSSIMDNRISGSEIAVRLFQSGMGTRIEGNSITSNSIGLEIASKLGKQDTILRGTDAELLAGDRGFSLVLANNTFTRNTSYDISNLTDKTVYASGNYWDGGSEEEPARVAGRVVIPSSAWKGTIALGTTVSLDQIVIARLLQLGLVAEGIKVIDLIGLGNAQMLKEALAAGDVDLALADPSFIGAKDLSDRGIAVSPPLAVEDRLMLVVSPDIAGGLHGNTISDLTAYLADGGTPLTIAVQRTISETELQSLASAYGIPLMEDNTTWTNGVDETETKLKLGTANAAIVHSIEETLTMMGFQALDDDQGVLAVSRTALLVQQGMIDAQPEIGAVEERLRPILTTDNLHSLVSKVRLLHSDSRDAAREFMLQHGLIEQ
ncbi:MAG: NosD domain-containing protein [Candidatus Bipolaricaulota bacterium]|nr:NosD domain-containing protein [Candidatus Bipolaricaulota bacterium]